MSAFLADGNDAQHEKGAVNALGSPGRVTAFDKFIDPSARAIHHVGPLGEAIAIESTMWNWPPVRNCFRGDPRSSSLQ
jgi:hypothetical protein